MNFLWVDKRFPQDAIAQLLSASGIEPQPFCEWLGRRLAAYRNVQDFAAEQPSLADEIKKLKALRSALDAAVKAFSPSSYSARTKALISTMLERQGVNFYDASKTAKEQAILLSAALRIVERQLQAAGAQRGRKPKYFRNDLFADVVEQLSASKLPVEERRVLASEILQACSIEAPTDVREQRRISNIGAKSRPK